MYWYHLLFTLLLSEGTTPRLLFEGVAWTGLGFHVGADYRADIFDGYRWDRLIKRANAALGSLARRAILCRVAEGSWTGNILQFTFVVDQVEWSVVVSVESARRTVFILETRHLVDQRGSALVKIE
jgi:hypothetical protein